jgi:hypothetical protein
MIAETITAPEAGPGRSRLPGVSTRLVRYFKAQVEDWYDECRQLSKWEDEHLIDDAQGASLAEHARLLDELERAGQWLFRTTDCSDFPDRPTADLVSATLQDLKDRRAMWHGTKLSEEQKAKILKTCFNEP